MLPNLNYFKTTLHPLYNAQEARNLYYEVLTTLLKCDMTTLLLKGDDMLTEKLLVEFQNITQQLSSGKPIQHIFGETIFHGNRFLVNPNVLIPRPETEELVDWIIADNDGKKKEKRSLLDIGTGSGCIAISLKKALNDTDVFALDISEKALETAKKNADLNQTEICFIHDDILHPKNIPDGWAVDTIVSNPPYIRMMEKSTMHQNVLEHDPHIALFVSDEDPLVFYREIARFGQIHLNKGGFLYFEINEDLSDETRRELEKFGYQKIIIKKDVNGKDRMIRCEKY